MTMLLNMFAAKNIFRSQSLSVIPNFLPGGMAAKCAPPDSALPLVQRTVSLLMTRSFSNKAHQSPEEKAPLNGTGLLHGMYSALGGFDRSNLSRGLSTESEQEHIQSITCDYDAMKVVVIPGKYNNYMYLLIDTASNEAAVVDPDDHASLVQRVRQENVKLTTILETHHFYLDAWDRRCNIVKLTEMLGNKLTVVGDHVREKYRVDAVYKNIFSDGDELNLGSLTIKGLYIPGQTCEYICYYVTGPGAQRPIVFTGNVLLIAGCGPFCDDATKTNALLNEKLASLPDDTQVFCLQERTLNNLKFAQAVEPENEYISQRLQHFTKVCKNLLPSVPSTIGEEKKTNPYMRVAEDSVQSYAQARNAIRAMACLRILDHEFHKKR